jgi:hypothetical protein
MTTLRRRTKDGLKQTHEKNFNKSLRNFNCWIEVKEKFLSGNIFFAVILLRLAVVQGFFDEC